MILPQIALAVRQPWAWAIIHGGKDIENRSAYAVNKGAMRAPTRIAIHASARMTQHEYDSALAFMAMLGVTCPPAAHLDYGGIIGAVRVQEIVKHSASPWYFGPRGLVLEDAEPHPFIRCDGQLGYFKWHAEGILKPPVPRPRWMMRAIEPPLVAPAVEPTRCASEASAPDLFSELPQ